MQEGGLLVELTEKVLIVTLLLVGVDSEGLNPLMQIRIPWLNPIFLPQSGPTALAKEAAKKETDEVAYGCAKNWWRLPPGVCLGWKPMLREPNVHQVLSCLISSKQLLRSPAEPFAKRRLDLL